MERICFKSVIAIFDGHHTFNMYKALQRSIIMNNLMKELEQVIDFYEVRVDN